MTVSDDKQGEKVTAGNGTNEDDDLLVREILDPERAERLRIATIVISVLSVICTSLEGSITMAIAIMESSAASFAFAFTALLDSLTSVVVIWRYCGSKNDIFAFEKERRALCILGVLFVLSFATTFAKSVYSIVFAVLPRKDALTWYVAIANTIISASLAIAKFYLSIQLKSTSIFTDGINSSVSMLLAAAIVASSVVYDTHNSVWYLDAVVGIICACFILVYGIKLLHSGRSYIGGLCWNNGSSKQDYVEMDSK